MAPINVDWEMLQMRVEASWILGLGLILLGPQAQATQAKVHEDSCKINTKESSGTLECGALSAIQLMSAKAGGRANGKAQIEAETLATEGSELSENAGFVPPGLAKKDDFVPPGLANKDGFVPPGLAKKDDFVPPGLSGGDGSAQPIPEPTGLVLFAGGLLLAQAALRRRLI
jgi:hypothetical protein